MKNQIQMRKCILSSALFLSLLPVLNGQANKNDNQHEFIENKGQVDDQKSQEKIYYYAQMPGGTILITNEGVSYVLSEIGKDPGKEVLVEEEFVEKKSTQALKYHKIKVNFKGGHIEQENMEPLEKNETYYNYYYAHCPQGILNVSSYKGVMIKDLYSGIDWKISQNGKGGVKTEFIVHPGADPNQIAMNYEGAEELELEKEGYGLTMKTTLGDIRETGLVTYYDESHREIHSNYVLKNKEVHFQMGNYDASKRVVIDPPLIWGTYHGDAGSQSVTDMINGFNDDLYSCGYTSGNSVSATLYANPGGGAYFDNSYNGNTDVGIFRFDNLGRKIWGTYYGGTNIDRANSIDYIVPIETISTRSPGGIALTGYTTSINFPTTSGAFQTTNAGSSDIFYLRFDLNGVRKYATYFGGSSSDYGNQIVANSDGNTFIAGSTTSSNFPVLNATQATYGGAGDAILVSFERTNSILLFSTYLGNSSNDAAYSIDDAKTNISKYIYIGGSTSGFFPTAGITVVPQSPLNILISYNGGTTDGFITKYDVTNQSSPSIPWSAYFGGNQEDEIRCITAVSSNYVFYANKTQSSNLLTCSAYKGGGDAYVNYFSEASGVPVPATGDYYGSTALDIPNRMRHNGNFTNPGVYIVGETLGSNFSPILSTGNSAYYNQMTYGGVRDGFILYIAASANSLLCSTINWGTYYGGSGNDKLFSCSRDSKGCLWTGGESSSTSLGSPTELYNPGSGAYYQSVYAGSYDQMYAKFCDCPQVNAGNDQVLCCIPQSIQLGSNPALPSNFTYSWSPSTGLSSTTTPNTTASFSTVGTTTYTVTRTNTLTGCISSDAVTITRNTACCRLAQEETAELQVSLYPNPGSGQYVLSTNKSFTSDAVVNVYDLSGKLISTSTWNMNNSNHNLDISDQPNGIYMVRVVDGAETYVHQVVKE